MIVMQLPSSPRVRMSMTMPALPPTLPQRCQMPLSQNWRWPKLDGTYVTTFRTCYRVCVVVSNMVNATAALDASAHGARDHVLFNINGNATSYQPCKHHGQANHLSANGATRGKVGALGHGGNFHDGPCNTHCS